MNPTRRRWLQRLAAAAAAGAAGGGGRAAEPTAGVGADGGGVRRGRVLRFPRDHGAHVETRTEWWYATGWSGPDASHPRHGWQVTFFRSRTGLAVDSPSRFAARHLLFAHAAVTDLAAGRHHHDQRLARWNGDPGAARAAAAIDDAAVRIGDWSIRRGGGAPAAGGDDRARADGWRATIAADGFALDLRLQPTQPPLLQGDAGWSRKGPRPEQASHYVSIPQLAVGASIGVAGEAATRSTVGRGWIDHEWSDEILDPQAVGWDWIGINLLDGSALTAFVLRRRDGSPLWAGGSFRAASGALRVFGADEVAMVPGQRWRSAATGAEYPVHWQVATPAGRWTLRALVDTQELDSRASTGTVYWEGLSELLDAGGGRVGLGYLEMTGYVGTLRL